MNDVGKQFGVVIGVVIGVVVVIECCMNIPNVDGRIGVVVEIGDVIGFDDDVSDKNDASGKVYCISIFVLSNGIIGGDVTVVIIVVGSSFVIFDMLNVSVSVVGSGVRFGKSSRWNS